MTGIQRILHFRLPDDYDGWFTHAADATGCASGRFSYVGHDSYLHSSDSLSFAIRCVWCRRSSVGVCPNVVLSAKSLDSCATTEEKLEKIVLSARNRTRNRRGDALTARDGSFDRTECKYRVAGESALRPLQPRHTWLVGLDRAVVSRGPIGYHGA